jgi:hypothetical protein
MYVPAIDSKESDLWVHFAKTYDFIDKNRKKSNVRLELRRSWCIVWLVFREVPQ